MHVLEDSHGRTFSYLRLSVTDVCNFRCAYCLPHGYEKPSSKLPELSISEMECLVRAFVSLGVWKVRLTGGEPTVRRDIVDIVRTVAGTPGVRAVGLTTNGYRIRPLLPPLRDAGLTHLNVSIDTLDPVDFRTITGRDRLAEIRSAVEEALEIGMPSVKVNAVLLKSYTWTTLSAFTDWVFSTPISVRFIELMQTGDNGKYFRHEHLSSVKIADFLESHGWLGQERAAGDGPAVEFRHPNYQGRIGLIAPYSPRFCASCNRLRVTCQGELRLCLFGEKNFSLRPWLASPQQHDELIEVVRNLVRVKPQAHFLHEGKYGNTNYLAAIGG